MKFIIRLLLFLIITASNAKALCGDCDDDCAVTIEELTIMLDLGLDGEESPTCGDCNESGLVDVGDLVVAIENAMYPDPLDACFDVPEQFENQDTVVDDYLEP